jgi:glutamate/tyrosine decarboxylase-like PLP-dependent enzyme
MSVDFISKLNWLPQPVTRFLERRMKKIPSVKRIIDKENEKMMLGLEKSLKPYKGKFESYSHLPQTGLSHDKILNDVRAMSETESVKWKAGKVSACVFHGGEEHLLLHSEIYALHSENNPLHADLFPSAGKFESEIVSMVAYMLGKGTAPHNQEVCGTVSTGGTESIMMAMKTYRDKAEEELGVTEPEMILPISAHPAFDKAAQYFKIKQIKLPLNDDKTVDVSALEKAINRNTVVIVGSAPAFPHGMIDNIKEMSDIALQHQIGFHVDACVGGFVLPFAEKAGYDVPVVDFRNPGVTSISVDTHKYGYAAKGSSVLLYRTPELRQYQYFVYTDWPGGLYSSPSMSGSRPGALSAACWASLISIGEQGYMEAVKAIFETAKYIKAEVAKMEDINVISNPLWVIAFESKTLNIYEVLDQMAKRGWKLNGLQQPAGFHIAITFAQTREGVKEQFVSDLKASVTEVKTNPGQTEGLAPIYGIANNTPFRGVVSDILKGYLDVIYKI